MTQNFFSRHLTKFLVAGMCAAGYSMISLLALQMQTSVAARYEEFNPRRKGEPLVLVNESVDKVVYVIGDATNQAASYPWKAMGLVTHDRYTTARQKAFNVAGVDENNAKHDKKRFAFYRQMGFAVRKTDDLSQSIYIPFASFRKYIEGNSTSRIDGWDAWEEVLPNPGWKSYSVLQGKAFYKADSASQGGNEDGVVDNIEWATALQQMGYRTMESAVTDIMKRTDAQHLGKELEQLVVDIRTNPGCIMGNVPETIPREKLDAYVQ